MNSWGNVLRPAAKHLKTNSVLTVLIVHLLFDLAWSMIQRKQIRYFIFMKAVMDHL